MADWAGAAVTVAVRVAAATSARLVDTARIFGTPMCVNPHYCTFGSRPFRAPGALPTLHPG